MVFPKRNSDFQSPNPEVPGGSHAHFDWLEIGHVTPEAKARMSVTTEELRYQGGPACPSRSGIGCRQRNNSGMAHKTAICTSFTE